MIHFTTYNPETGEIIAAYTVANELDRAANIPTGLLALDGIFSNNEYYINDEGIATLYPSERPTPNHHFDKRTGWVDSRSAEEISNALPEAIENARKRIIAISKDFEDRFITPLPAQTMKYERKESDARDYVNAYDNAVAVGNPLPDPTQYPWVNAEVGLTAATPYEVAQVYLNLAYQWQMIAVEYEPLRLFYTAQIELAQSEEELETSVNQYQVAIFSLTQS